MVVTEVVKSASKSRREYLGHFYHPNNCTIIFVVHRNGSDIAMEEIVLATSPFSSWVELRDYFFKNFEEVYVLDKKGKAQNILVELKNAYSVNDYSVLTGSDEVTIEVTKGYDIRCLNNPGDDERVVEKELFFHNPKFLNENLPESFEEKKVIEKVRSHLEKMLAGKHKLYKSHDKVFLLSYDQAVAKAKEQIRYTAWLPYGSAFYGESRDNDLVTLIVRGENGRVLPSLEDKFLSDELTIDADTYYMDTTRQVDEFGKLVLACVATEYPELSFLMPSRDELLEASEIFSHRVEHRAYDWPFDFYLRKALFARRQFEALRDTGEFVDTKSKLKLTPAEERLMFHQATPEDFRQVFFEMFGEEPQDVVIDNGFLVKGEERHCVCFDSCGHNVENETTLEVLRQKRFRVDLPKRVNVSDYSHLT